MFKNLLGRVLRNRDGTTFLIKGAPDAGKSTLLYECRKYAEDLEWEVADIRVSALWNPNKLLSSLRYEKEYEVTEKSTQIGVKDIMEGGYKSVRSEPQVRNILKDGKQPLLLILDEA